MAETALFFPTGRRSLFGVLHEPASARRSTYVFVHPFGEEKLWTHRVFVSFARQLASEGHAVLRFDCAGAGDSDGESADVSVETLVADVSAAVGFVRSKTGSSTVSLLGLRFGATIAALAAEQLAEVHQLILWAPIVDGARYMQDLLRINLTTQMATHRAILQDREAMVATLQAGGTVNVDGYEMSLPLYAQASAVRLVDAVKAHAGPCAVIGIERHADRPAKELEALGATYPRGVVMAVREEPFWKEIAAFYERAPNLFRATSDWLGQHP